jgi:hypothetical protein
MYLKHIAAIAAVILLGAAPASAVAWPTWGNLETGDCTFAAAADWALLHGGTSATDESVRQEYLALDPNEEGISAEGFANYWERHGIAGVRADTTEVPPERLSRELHRHGPVVVWMAVTPKQRWGAIQDVEGGMHFAVVTRTDRRGPVILTWGELAQMTWWQWREDALGVYVPRRL